MARQKWPELPARPQFSESLAIGRSRDYTLECQRVLFLRRHVDAVPQEVALPLESVLQASVL